MKLKIVAPLHQNEYYVLDGGFSTQLSRYVKGVDTDPLWTARSLVDNAEAVRKVHRDFLTAGARIVLTCSYQVSGDLFKEELGLSRAETRDHIVNSARLAWAAVEDTGGVRGHSLVGGSVSPYGACLHDGSEYTGAYLRGEAGITHQQLVDWHRDRVEALQDGGVSFIAIETIPVYCEALAVMDTVMEAGLLPVWVSFTLKDEAHLAGGETIKQAVAAVKNHQLARNGKVMAIGFNCSAPAHITGALKEARSVWSEIPFVIYPNTGETWECGSWSGDKDNSWLELIPQWVRLGALVIGGCCRVDSGVLPQIKKQLLKGIMSNC